MYVISIDKNRLKKEPSIQTETLIDTYIRKLTKSLKYKITWSQISALFYNFLTSKGFRCLKPFLNLTQLYTNKWIEIFKSHRIKKK